MTQTALTKNEKNGTKPASRQYSRPVTVPDYEVVKQEDAFEIVAQFPGVPESNLDIELEDQWLKIKGSSEEPEMKGFEKVFSEFSATDYECGFKISNDIDNKHISASLTNGVLKVRLPKTNQSIRKSIAVNAS